MRADDHLWPTTVCLECNVIGCGATFEIPVVYRLEREPESGKAFVSTRVVVDVDATLALEAPLRAHLDEHATNGAPPVDEPPPWQELEHCDEGATCQHDACLDYAREIAEYEHREAAR